MRRARSPTNEGPRRSSSANRRAAARRMRAKAKMAKEVDEILGCSFESDNGICRGGVPGYGTVQRFPNRRGRVRPAKPFLRSSSNA